MQLDSTFTDLYARFSRLRQTVENQRANQETLQGRVREYKEKLRDEQNRYCELRKTSLELVQKANQEIEDVENSLAKETQGTEKNYDL